MIKNLILILFTIMFALSAMAEDINIDAANVEPAAPPSAEAPATENKVAPETANSQVAPDRKPARKRRKRTRRRRHHRRHR